MKRVHPFRVHLESYLDGSMNVLDAGCGDGLSFTNEYQHLVRKMVGLDLVLENACKNTQVDVAVVGDLTFIPLIRGHFDLIFSHDVLEHLRDPETVFQEFSRVLKPGGLLLFLTPNNRHYFAIAGHIIPMRAQAYIARNWFKDPGTVYRTYYRCNSANQIRKVAAKAGFSIETLEYYEPGPKYLARLPLVFGFAFLYERIVNQLQLLAPFRAQIVGVLRRNW